MSICVKNLSVCVLAKKVQKNKKRYLTSKERCGIIDKSPGRGGKKKPGKAMVFEN